VLSKREIHQIHLFMILWFLLHVLMVDTLVVTRLLLSYFAVLIVIKI
jgi:hypothetical protein